MEAVVYFYLADNDNDCIDTWLNPPVIPRSDDRVFIDYTGYNVVYRQISREVDRYEIFVTLWKI